ncbi:Transposon Tf2-6 polyprotein, partial [Pichia kudriavzevii]
MMVLHLWVHTDACGTALGYVLEQLDPDGKLRGKLIGSELNYSIYGPAYDREFLAVVEALKNWRYYLLNRHFSYDEDNEIKEIYDILKENLPIPKSIHNHIKHYSIEDNLLYFS